MNNTIIYLINATIVRCVVKIINIKCAVIIIF